jgi:hypothetical protein
MSGWNWVVGNPNLVAALEEKDYDTNMSSAKAATTAIMVERFSRHDALVMARLPEVILKFS